MLRRRTCAHGALGINGHLRQAQMVGDPPLVGRRGSKSLVVVRGQVRAGSAGIVRPTAAQKATTVASTAPLDGLAGADADCAGEV